MLQENSLQEGLARPLTFSILPSTVLRARLFSVSPLIFYYLRYLVLFGLIESWKRGYKPTMTIIRETAPLFHKSWLLFRKNKVSRIFRILIIPALLVRLFL